jgi:hypothetical protein
MKPFIHVAFLTGHVYEVPASTIVNHRAAYYHGSQPEEFPTLADAVKDSEELFASDDYAVEDWAKNNMDWDEIAPHARLISFTPVPKNWMEATLTSHTEQAKPQEPGDGVDIMDTPIETVVSSMAANAQLCNIMTINAPDGRLVAAVITVMGEVETYINYISQLTEQIVAYRRQQAEQAAAEQPASSIILPN